MPDSSFISGFSTGFGSAFLQFALERLANFGSFAWKEIRLILGVEEELRKLHRTFLKIQDLVDYVESSPLRFSNGSKAWQIWFEDLRRLSYDADALLDHISLSLSKPDSKDSLDLSRESHNVQPKIRSALELHLPHKINEMQMKLEDLAKEMKSLLKIEKVKMDIIHHKRKTKTGERSHSTSLLVDEGVIVGRQQDKENIIKLLGEKHDDDDDVSIIPLVGMGGIGKTTLARLIFNDAEACKDFKKKIWVTVSEDFDMVMITKSIIECATQRICEMSDLDWLQRELQKILICSGKFLLVLDDYWNESHDDWELLFSPVRSAFRGSKVMVTTRSSTVATVVGSTGSYHLQGLRDDDCWKLIKQIAFFKKQNKKNLESLGQEIAKKCKGLPLAAKTLGRVLHCKSSEDEWHSILKSELWNLPQDRNSVYPSLMLSYLHLPAHLKKCFAYCSIFPQNHEFELEELVLLWVAEGFIQPGGERRMEDVGADYFYDLHSRSLFTQGKNSSNKIIYKMHDLIHDLARLVSTDTCFQMKTNHYSLFGNACHLALHHDNVQPLHLKASYKNERLRTFLVICKNGVSGGLIDRELFLNLKFVRVLDLSNIGLGEVPDSIFHLIYLRYLNVSGNRIQSLPTSVCELLALQTLKLSNCPKLIDLPDVKKLSNLRHLVFDMGAKVQCMPYELGNLTNLQTLTAFVVRNKKGCRIEELKEMNSLRGSLSIKNIENVINEKDARDANLDKKPYLNKLRLLWEELKDEDSLMVKQAQVLENLRPHENLKELEIKNYSGMKCPGWLSNSCSKFTSIHLQGLGNCTELPSFGLLQHLKSLTIGEMHALKCVDDKFYGDGNGEKFPSLEFLEVYQMEKLVQWKVDSNGSICMRRLTNFSIDNCPQLTDCPSYLRSIRHLNISRCPGL